MLINDIKAKSYKQSGSSLEVVLQCDINTALNIDDSLIKVTTDEGSITDVFSGYTRVDTSLDAMSGYVTVRYEVVDGILAESLASVSLAIKNSMQASNDAKQTADEAKTLAEQAGTHPSVAAAARMYVNASVALTNTELADVRDLIDDFKQGGEYEKGAIRKYDGKYWRMAQKINSTTSPTYLPGTGTESLYTLIDLAPDGIRIWHMPTDATNSFALGEKAHHPGEDGPVYVSKRDGNTSEPGTDEWWTLAE